MREEEGEEEEDDEEEERVVREQTAARRVASCVASFVPALGDETNWPGVQWRRRTRAAATERQRGRADDN